MKKNIRNGGKNPLKPVCVAGLILALIISWMMVLLALFGESPGIRKIETGAFAYNLKEYDLFDVQKWVMDGEDPLEIERRFSVLQEQASSVEEQLSVLKRLRALALIDRRYTGAYAKAAMEATEEYTYSAPLAAVAAEAVVLASPDNAPALLKSYSSRLSQNRFNLFNLCLQVIAGELENPASAAALPEFPDLLSMDISAFPPQIRKDLFTNEFLLFALKNDISGATSRINSLLNTDSLEFSRLGAEFYYDHSNPLGAAELFLRLDDGIARAADALALAGEIKGARNIWLALSAETGSGRLRSLYNLASSSTDQNEEESWLEKLFTLPKSGQSIPDMEAYSVIRYSRLLDAGSGITVLEDFRQDPLPDLELLRRRQADWPKTRATSEVWILLGRHSENEDLYEWAAWYFEHQKLYSEIEQLLKEATRKGMTGSWIDLHKSLTLIREGKIPEAEKILMTRYQSAKPADWRISANLGRISENRRAVASALEFYQDAASQLPGYGLTGDRKMAAQLQMRLSRCLEALGRDTEGLRALEMAYELDSDNVNIRREYSRVFR